MHLKRKIQVYVYVSEIDSFLQSYIHIYDGVFCPCKLMQHHIYDQNHTILCNMPMLGNEDFVVTDDANDTSSILLHYISCWQNANFSERNYLFSQLIVEILALKLR